VILLTKGGEKLAHPPGRDLLVSSQHTFAELATAIDRAFARWDLSHLHEFRLLHDRRIVMEDADELEEADSGHHLNEKVHTLSSAGLREGDTFCYVFDFGDRWEHGCTVMRVDVDDVQSDVGREIVPIFGWGTIPDQYGRSSQDDDPADD
jgi:hypothetical protein